MIFYNVDIIALTLSNLNNIILAQEVFPDSLKKAKIFSIYEKNYHLISILPTCRQKSLQMSVLQKAI